MTWCPRQRQLQPSELRVRRCPSLKTCSSLSTVSSFAQLLPRPTWTYSELRESLGQLLSSRFDDVLRGFANFDPCCQGYVLPSEALRVFNTFLFPLTERQFTALLASEGEYDCHGRVNYKAFLQRLSGICSSLAQTGYISPHMTTDELEHLLKEGITQELKNIIKALVLFDYAQDGQIQKHELRKILENYCFKIPNQQFEELWRRYDPNQNNVISYGRFLAGVGVNASLARKYLPCDSPVFHQHQRREKYEGVRQGIQATRQPMIECPDDPSFQGKTPNQICENIVEKLKEPGMDILVYKGCQRHDPSSTGLICIEDFHGVFNQFVIPLSRGTFEYFLKKYYIRENLLQVFPYKDFVNDYCGSTTPQILEYLRSPFDVKQTPILKRVKRTIRKIERHTVNGKSEFIRNLNVISYRGTKIVTRLELRKVIKKLKFNIHEEELRDMYLLLDPYTTSVIPIHAILEMFEQPQIYPKEEYVVEELMRYSKPRGFPSLQGIDFLAKLRSYATRVWGHILATLQRQDQRGDGKIPQRILRDVLEEFCFGMTDEQFQFLVKGHLTSGDHIYYQSVMAMLQQSPEEATGRYLRDVRKLLHQRHDYMLPTDLEDPLRRIRQWMIAYGGCFLKDCLLHDPRRSGSLSRKDFRHLLNQRILRLNNQQFDALWSEVPKDSSGKVDYAKFYTEFSAPMC